MRGIVTEGAHRPIAVDGTPPPPLRDPPPPFGFAALAGHG
ncbi:hypothetical protein SAMN02799626_03980 [Caulobacter sp. UNC279MFTsu5.1]|nr:hypothetical protein SAMN02799626_03980 [Caulobacter sp. UNC279MFTsu5.1]